MLTKHTVWSLLLQDLYPQPHPTAVRDPEIPLADSYLSLPVRVELIVAYALLYLTTVLIKWCILIPLRVLTTVHKRKSLRNPDSLAFLTTIATLYLLRNVDTSKIYHKIRSTTLVKLYFMIQVLEVADKLLTTTAFDILTPLYSTTNPPLIFLPLALIYLYLHSYITLYQIISLNIAVNSYSNALLTVILSNHFSRLKSAIFKKLKPEQDLPRLIHQDASLRFLLLIFLLTVLARNALHAGSTGALHAAQLAALTLASQSLVDALKHVYIAKINATGPATYTKIHATLASTYLRAKNLPSEYNIHSLDRVLGVSVQVIVVAVYKLLVFPAFNLLLHSTDSWFSAGFIVPALFLGVVGLLLLRVWAVLVLDAWSERVNGVSTAVAVRTDRHSQDTRESTTEYSPSTVAL